MNTVVGFRERREPADKPAGARPGPCEPDIGGRLREFRKLRGAPLREIAARAGVSESFLSQLERGRTNASLATARRLAHALGLELADLFTDECPKPTRVLTHETRPRLSFGQLGTKELLTLKPFRHIEAFIGTLEPRGTTGPEPLVHGPSQELLYVLRGAVRLDLGEESYLLQRGHSIDYDSSIPHLVTALEGGAEVLWVISPPSWMAGANVGRTMDSD